MLSGGSSTEDDEHAAAVTATLKQLDEEIERHVAAYRERVLAAFADALLCALRLHLPYRVVPEECVTVSEAAVAAHLDEQMASKSVSKGVHSLEELVRDASHITQASSARMYAVGCLDVHTSQHVCVVHY